MADITSYRARFQDARKAANYAARFADGSRRRIDRREQRAVQKIFGALAECQSVLDVPAGAGRFAAALTQHNRRLIEMDAALEILRHAERRARQPGVPAAFVQGDAARLPLVNGAVDCIFCNRLLHHILVAEERAAILREFHRVSRRYVVVSFFDYRHFAAARRLLKAFKGSKPRYEGQPTRAQFEGEVEGCGFRVRDVALTGPAWIAQKYFVLEKA